MRPPAPASPPERRGPAGSPARLLAAAWAGIACLLPACTASEWSDRDPIVVRGAPLDTLEFLPPGSRHILLDSLTEVRVAGIRLGYRCTEILAFGPEWKTSPVPGYAVRLDFRLPADPDCPLETGVRDSVIAVRFAAADGPTVRLLDSLGTVLDSAEAVRGRLSHDSLELKGSAATAFNSRFFFQDTSMPGGRLLRADSLSSCERLNHAEYARKSDTLAVVRYSWVTLDVPVPGDTCRWTPADRVIVPLAR